MNSLPSLSASTQTILAMEDRPYELARLAFRRLSPALGAEIKGLDVATLASPDFGPFLHRALLDHQLLLLRGLDLDPAGFRQLCGCLGPLRPVPGGMQAEPGMPDVQRLSNLGPDGQPTGRNPDSYSLHWHADGSATPIPSRLTALYAVRVPKQGGDTHFLDMYAACAALDPARRQALVGRFAIHDPELARYFRYGSPVVPSGMSLYRRLRLRLRFIIRMFSSRTTRHPVICLHEETGRPCLFIGDHAWRITGYRWSIGARLVNELNTFATANPAWQYTHSWQVGDLLVWDNRCLLHRGSNYDTGHQERVMLRAVVNGGAHVLVAAPV